MQFIYILE